MTQTHVDLIANSNYSLAADGVVEHQERLVGGSPRDEMPDPIRLVYQPTPQLAFLRQARR